MIKLSTALQVRHFQYTIPVLTGNSSSSVSFNHGMNDLPINVEVIVDSTESEPYRHVYPLFRNDGSTSFGWIYASTSQDFDTTSLTFYRYGSTPTDVTVNIAFGGAKTLA